MRTAVTSLAMAFLAAAMLFVLASSPVQAHPSSFPDVAETNPVHEAAESLLARGIMTGVGGDFEPYAELSRGLATKAIVIWRGALLGDDAANLEPAPFNDVGFEYIPYVAAAYALGWIGGYSDSTFRPHSFLTREQMAVVTIRSLGLEPAALALSESEIIASLDGFTDRGAISPSAKPHVALAVARGLLGGNNGQLDPQAFLTRGQFALVLTRADGLALDDPDTTIAPETDNGQDPPDSEEDPPPSARQALAAFMDARLFRPHDSPVTGEMVLQNADWYGIPPLPQLVIMAAETSFGDPDLGGTLARNYNFGCLRYGGRDTPWGQLSDGSVGVAGGQWYSFATPQLGMAAFGRFLKVGANGYFKPILASPDPDWADFAVVYYGREAPGFDNYVARLNALEDRIREMAAEDGVSF